MGAELGDCRPFRQGQRILLGPSGAPYKAQKLVSPPKMEVACLDAGEGGPELSQVHSCP